MKFTVTVQVNTVIQFIPSNMRAGGIIIVLVAFGQFLASVKGKNEVIVFLLLLFGEFRSTTRVATKSQKVDTSSICIFTLFFISFYYLYFSLGITTAETV